MLHGVARTPAAQKGICVAGHKQNTCAASRSPNSQTRQMHTRATLHSYSLAPNVHSQTPGPSHTKTDFDAPGSVCSSLAQDQATSSSTHAKPTQTARSRTLARARQPSSGNSTGVEAGLKKCALAVVFRHSTSRTVRQDGREPIDTRRPPNLVDPASLRTEQTAAMVAIRTLSARGEQARALASTFAGNTQISCGPLIGTWTCKCRQNHAAHQSCWPPRHPGRRAPCPVQ